MEYTTYASRLQYLDAADMDDGVVDYDGLSVQGSAGDQLGKVDGFIVEAQAGRLHYIVVDSGGWFRSRRFLLPVGHVVLDADRRTLTVDVSKDALSRYPEFDADRFRQFSDEDLRVFEARMAEACCPGDPSIDPARRSTDGAGRHYAQPSWWNTSAAGAPRRRASDRPRDESAAAVPETRDAAGANADNLERTGEVLWIDTKGERIYVGDPAEESRTGSEALTALADDQPRRSDR